jgi:hypothetical protein
VGAQQRIEGLAVAALGGDEQGVVGSCGDERAR